jgi:hypothetical protein
LQDRLVKELRLAGARTLAEGNALLPAFMADYNARFAKPPANKKDLHRPLRGGDDLEDAFAWKEERTLSQALTLQYDKVIFILEPSEQAKAAIGKRVAVYDYPDGRLSIRYKGIELAYRTFDKIRQIDQGAIADNKRLGPILANIRDEQLRRRPQRRSGPRRRDQRDARLFYERSSWRSLGRNMGAVAPRRGYRRRCSIDGPRASAIVKTAAGLLMLSSLDIVFNAPIRFILPARIKLTVERYPQVYTFLAGFDVSHPTFEGNQGSRDRLARRACPALLSSRVHGQIISR